MRLGQEVHYNVAFPFLSHWCWQDELSYWEKTQAALRRHWCGQNRSWGQQWPEEALPWRQVLSPVLSDCGLRGTAAKTIGLSLSKTPSPQKGLEVVIDYGFRVGSKT